MASDGMVLVEISKYAVTHKPIHYENWSKEMKFVLFTSKYDVLDWIEEECLPDKNNDAKEIYDILKDPRARLSYTHFVIGNKRDFYRFGVSFNNEPREYELYSFLTCFLPLQYQEI